MKEQLRVQKLIWRTMKLTFYQFVLMVLFAGIASAVTTNGQDLLNKEITIRSDGQDLKSILKSIEKQTGVRFVYSSHVIDTRTNVYIHVRKTPLSQALEHLFGLLKMRYQVSGKQIVIESAGAPPSSGKTAIQSYRPELTAIQSIVVKGKVTDERGEALPGVNILVKGTREGTATQADGEFELTVSDPEAILVFSFVGYLSKEVAVGNQKFLEVALEVDEKALEEVVVVGYGTQKKVNLTGSVSTIDAAELTAVPQPSLAQSMMGRAAGVFIKNGNGQPGQN